MIASISAYLLSIQREFETGNATEHSYRPCLKSLIEDIDSSITAINEPKRQKCGAPDYIITRKEVPIGFIEAKDVGKNLDEVEKSEQMDRYLESLENLILTDYLEFRFYIQGERVDAIRIARIENGEIIFEKENIERFENLLKNFVAYHGQTIKSASKLAKAMAGKARLMKDIIVKSLNDKDRGGELRMELEGFRKILIHDMKEEEFADMYAQTIAYGLFAARLHDPTLETFTRQEAAELLPKTNPFLRKLFHRVAGPDLDDRVVWIVDALADVYRASDIKKILASFSSESKRLDPFIHFYETFLSEYNPKLRKSRGVWYTPEPVVKFIVRAVDNILTEKFNLPKGLADTSMTTVEVEAQMADGRYKDGKKRMEKQVHRVQILDPATGTGTFLAEVVRKIHSHFEGQAGIWESYVNEHLLPRIHGFELLMAPYAMCHLKLDLLLTELGYRNKENNPERLSVYLTNSLEEAHPDTNTLFSSWLSNEANEANKIKKETPVMVVLGNPPYSGVSSNTGSWITEKIEDYKYIDGEHFGERKHWLQDDYVKFIRLAEHMIETNGEGIVGYVTNHGYLENPTFRAMRWHLLQTFDEIFVIDLHGNSKMSEVSPDGSKDENVFDIQQGVAILLAVKKSIQKQGKQPSKVFRLDFYGTRKQKNKELLNLHWGDLQWSEVTCTTPYYFFRNTDNTGDAEYNTGVSVSDLFVQNSMGFATARDAVTISLSKLEAEHIIKDFQQLTVEEVRSKYSLGNDSRDWKVLTAKEDVISSKSDMLRPIAYRPFDDRYSLFTGKSKGFYASPQIGINQHLLHGNIALTFTKRDRDDFFKVMVSDKPTDKAYVSSKDNCYIFPLYTYDPKSSEKQCNFNPEEIKKLEDKLKLKFDAQKEVNSSITDVFSPVDLFDYIYGSVHSLQYRSTNKAALKVGFPKIPQPKNLNEFRNILALGNELRRWHLLKHEKSDELITQFPISGTNIVEKKGYPKFKDGRVYINKEQYFDNVPEDAWNFYIGGYQPAQKWLKDRRNRTLSFDDILHWQKIIVALVNTDRIMKEIDEVWEQKK